MPKAGVQSRIVFAPRHAKRLLRALEKNVGKYERVSAYPHRMSNPFRHCLTLRVKHKIKKKTCSALIQNLLVSLQPKVYSFELI